MFKYRKLWDIVKTNKVIAIVPFYDGTNATMIYTHQERFCLVEKAKEVMDNYCKLYGASIEGRKSATRDYLGYRKNAPVLVTPNDAAFPLPSQYNNEEIWIIDLDFYIEELSPNKCKIVYPNDLSFIIPLSKRAVLARRARALEVLRAFTYPVGLKVA
ncbi:competence protein ComK [Ureibacillus sp. NPDC094379]